MTRATILRLNIFTALVGAIWFAPAIEAQDKKPSDIPVEDFAAMPQISDAKLSPDGQRIAYLIATDGKQSLIINTQDGQNPTLIPPPNDSTYIEFKWIEDDLLLLRTSVSAKGAAMNVVTKTRIFTFDITKAKLTWLGAPDRRQLKEAKSQTERIIDLLPHDAEHALIELDLNRNGDYEVYEVNLRSGYRKLRVRERRGVQWWYTDQSSDVRLGHGFRGKKRITRLKNASGDWVDLEEFGWTKKYTIEGFTDDPNILYVSGYGEHGTRALFTLNLDSGDIIAPLFNHPKFDMEEIITHPVSGRIIGVSYMDDFSKVHYLDPDFAAAQRSIDAAMQGTSNSILSQAVDKGWYFVLAEKDQNPGDFYIYDHPNKRMGFVASTRPLLNPELMGHTQNISIRVRDNSTIPAYLLLPHNDEPKKLPAIILVHGGPEARDTAEWDYEAQFYASRGYAVLKANFRGSSGYGLKFQIDGFKQWGGLMQDDVSDATKWLISEGVADPDRICIMGSSYGGYAALMGVIKEPNLYQCAVSVNGVTNLPRLKSSDRRNSIGGRSWTQRMGLTGVDDKQVSPFHRAHEINVPVLLMSSVDDARVHWKMSEDMHKRLKKLKKDSTYVKIKDGTHHMVTANSRLTALKAAETFLAKHIGD